MRRILTLVAALAFVALFAMPAQAQEKSSVRFGIQGGVTSSTISGDDVPDEGISSKTGFWAGGKFNYFFAQNWSVALEANWLSGLGAKFASGSFESETKISYFSRSPSQSTSLSRSVMKRRRGSASRLVSPPCSGSRAT
jgi:hypothetical protein